MNDFNISQNRGEPRLKKILIYLLILIPLFAVSGCSNKENEELTIVEIESNKIKKDSLEERLSEIQNEGIYGVSTKNNEYIIFNGVTNEYENVELNLEDEVLQILFNKVVSDISTKKVYELIPYPSEKYDTIQLIENGEQTHFENISIGD